MINIPFLKKIAQKGKPIFLSTGMSYLEEVEKALQAIYHYNKDVVLLQCTANYPICDTDANLNIFAYELLFRSSFINSYDGTDGDQATLDVINNSFCLIKREVGVSFHCQF